MILTLAIIQVSYRYLLGSGNVKANINPVVKLRSNCVKDSPSKKKTNKNENKTHIKKNHIYKEKQFRAKALLTKNVSPFNVLMKLLSVFEKKQKRH